MMHTLSPAERARQLSRPEGEVGLAVARWMNEANREAYAGFVRLLDLTPGARVLELGPGNAAYAADVIALAPAVRYTGLDISPTMVTEALRLNAELVGRGLVDVRLGAAEAMPFPDAAFDRVFAIGVMHFWANPEAALAEIRRVLRPGGQVLLGGQSPRSADETISAANGFFLRGAAEWDRLARNAGFGDVTADELATELPGPGGAPLTRHVIRLAARL